MSQVNNAKANDKCSDLKNFKNIFSMNLFKLVKNSTHYSSIIFNQKDLDLEDNKDVLQSQTDFFNQNNEIMFTLKHQAANVGRNKSEITVIILNDGSYFKRYETEKQRNYKFKLNEKEFSFLDRDNKKEKNCIELALINSMIKNLSFLDYKKFLTDLKEKDSLTYSNDKFSI